jgi:dihydrofolate reductase
MVLPLDHFFDAHNLDRQREADTFVLGANTFQGMRHWWPKVAEDPSFSPAVQDRPDVADVHREIAHRLQKTPKYVVSDSLTPGDTRPYGETTTIVPRAKAHDVVRELKEQDGKDILIIGSFTVWNDLLLAGLVDELHLMLGAAALGGGTSAFRGEGWPLLALLDVKRREDSDNVVLVYAVRNERA